jgi:hypothetical protein
MVEKRGKKKLQICYTLYVDYQLHLIIIIIINISYLNLNSIFQKYKRSLIKTLKKI